MTEQIDFLKMFSLYEPSAEYVALLSQAKIISAQIDPTDRSIAATIFSSVYMPQGVLDAAANGVALAYGLKNVNLNAKHPADQLSCIEPSELMAMFVDENPMTRGSLAGAKWNWQGTSLTVELLGNGKAELDACVPQVRARLHDRFDTDVEISIVAANNLEGEALFEAIDKMRSSIMSDIPFKAAPAKDVTHAPVNDAIFGKPFKGNVIPMRDLSLDMSFVAVEGTVFNVEHKELPKRNAWVINFDITDNTSSVRVSRFMEKKEAEPILSSIKVGKVVKVQ